jgi:hypothetical protein
LSLWMMNEMPCTAEDKKQADKQHNGKLSQHVWHTVLAAHVVNAVLVTLNDKRNTLRRVHSAACISRQTIEY